MQWALMQCVRKTVPLAGHLAGIPAHPTLTLFFRPFPMAIRQQGRGRRVRKAGRSCPAGGESAFERAFGSPARRFRSPVARNAKWRR